MGTDPRTVEAYNENADAYNQHVLDPNDSIYHAYYEKPAMRAELPDLTDLDVLSIGCGSGVDANWLAENGAKSVMGIDISEGLIEIARKQYPKIDFRLMDMEELDLDDESFDVLYSSLAIHYLDDWTKALSEARRVLKPGGIYIFSCGHPIDTAMERKKDGVTRSSILGRETTREGERRVYGDYMAAETDGFRPIDGVLGGFSVRIYHRPLSKMITQIHKAGFIIKKMVEPLPAQEMEKIDPDIYKQLTKIPEFMVWVLENEA